MQQLATLRGVLHDTISLAESDAEQPIPPAFPGEEELTRRTGPGRTAEIRTTRECARKALADLGVSATPILRETSGAPVWPPGVVGSMTHCDGYRGAAVALAATCRSIGIDAEPHLPLPENVAQLVAFGAEIPHLSELERSHDGISWGRLLFSAKESFYKAWFPLHRTWLDHSDIEVKFSQRKRNFVAKTITDSGAVSYSGRFVVTEDHILTAVVVDGR